MKYPFPIIKNISQILPLIKDKPEFIVAEKTGGYTVVNYVVQTSDTFPPVYGSPIIDNKECMMVNDFGDIVIDILMHQKDMTLLRELRGCIFETATGNILHRRYHKFFNVGERPETQLSEIDFSKPHVILEKLDGSMITPVQTTDGIRWGTKMGITEVALPVEEFVAGHPEYAKFAKACLAKGQTPIFEWCSRKQAIVIDYPEDMLVLTAMRDNVHGTYSTYQELFYMGQGWKIPVVKAYAGTASSMADLVDQTRGMIGVEGFVVRFEDGHMIKVKAEDYLLKHKTKDSLSLEKNVIEILVSEKADDLKTYMDAKDLERFNKFEEDFWSGVKHTTGMLLALRCQCRTVDRKIYAVEFVQKRNSQYSKFLYKMFDPMDNAAVFAMVKEAIAKSCSSQTKVNEVRWMFNCEWNAKPILE